MPKLARQPTAKGSNAPKNASALYNGWVYHGRHTPFPHHFRYRVFTLWLDLDALDILSQKHRFFSCNRWNVFSFYDKDHGERDGTPVKDWILKAAEEHKIDLSEGKIYFLGFPRLWGFVFNPLSLFYCYDRNGALKAIMYQVKNTFGGQHGYFLPVKDQRTDGYIAQECEKSFYVSPFIQMDCQYKFRVTNPGEHFDVAIHQFTHEGKILTATWNGEHSVLNDTGIVKCTARLPFMTFKILAAIHWQALKLWLKGAKFIPEPKQKTS